MRSPTRLPRQVAAALACAGLAVAVAAAFAGVLGSADAAAPRTPPTPQPDVPRLTVAPAVIPATGVTVGSTVTYTASVRNTGKIVTGMSVGDTLPDGVALIAADADQGGACTIAMPRVTCTWDSLNTGLTATAVFVVQVIVPGMLVNSVQLVPSDPVNTVITTGPAPAPLQAGVGVPIRFAATATVPGK